MYAIRSYYEENHPDIATKVFNETLKEEIRAYYRLITSLENSYYQYDNVVKQTIRPYLAKNLVLNPDFLFENQNQSDNPNILNLEQFYLIIKRDRITSYNVCYTKLLRTNLK